MEIVYLLVPMAVLIAIGIVAVFLWAVKSGQFDDLEGPAHRILMDEEAADAPNQISGRGGETADGTSVSRGPRLDPVGEENNIPPDSGKPEEDRGDKPGQS